MIADRGIENRGRIPPPGRGSRRRALGAAPLALLFLLCLSPSARAEDCPIIDPDCLTETVEETVDAVEGTVTAIVDQAEQTVEETERSVGETADEVVGQVEAIIEGVVDSPRGDEDGNGARKKAAKKPRRIAGVEENALRTGASLGEPRLLRLPDHPYVPVGLVRGRDLEAAESGSTTPGVGEAAARLAFPVLLALIIAVFLAIQNRIDRSDPKLAGASELPDHLVFQ